MTADFLIPSQAFLKVAGADAAKLLQGQLTCDVANLSSGEIKLGAHCNPQGRVISLFRIGKFNEDFILQMHKDMIPVAMSALQKYAVFYKVKLEPIALSCVIVKTPTPYQSILQKQINQTQWHIITNVVIDESNDLIWNEMEWQQGITTIYPETSAKFLPHELNLPQLGAVSFTKGCYTGQEIIARMNYRGTLKKGLYRAKFAGNASVNLNADIYNEKTTAGAIVDYYYAQDELHLLILKNSADEKVYLDNEKKLLLEIL